MRARLGASLSAQGEAWTELGWGYFWLSRFSKSLAAGTRTPVFAVRARLFSPWHRCPVPHHDAAYPSAWGEKPASLGRAGSAALRRTEHSQQQQA
jgi:hypothetical protein